MSTVKLSKGHFMGLSLLGAMFFGAVVAPSAVLADEPEDDAENGTLAVVVKDYGGDLITGTGSACLGDPGKTTTHRCISIGGTGTAQFEMKAGTYWVEVKAECYETKRFDSVKVEKGKANQLAVNLNRTCD